MKRKSKLLLFSIGLALTACTSKDITIEDFESGTFEKWEIEGEAFNETPIRKYENQQQVKGYSGIYLANSYNKGDGSKGSLTSSEFMIERNYINFLLGGGAKKGNYIELLVDGASVLKSHPLANNETLTLRTWDVTQYVGKNAKIRIVDQHQGGWGHILVDDIIQSDKKRSKIEENHTIEMSGDKNYILIPINDTVSEKQVSLLVDGNSVFTPMNIRIAEKAVSYWIPIDIQAYKGKNIKLNISHIESDHTGYKQIKESDTFHFENGEKYRPNYHFTPKYGWMNDPNGMVYHNGEYHLYYQYNPYGSVWGNMHWGHAVSKDLAKWEHLPVALDPDTLGTIFSGSAVIDHNNTAGFGKDALVALYTSAGDKQAQSIAYSLDNGRTFTKYDNNPVIPNPGVRAFRDPKVCWHSASNQWIMVLATSPTISFFGSKDLKTWDKLSEFGEGVGAHGGVWECPDLIPLTYNGQKKWVLLVSINPGGPNDGSATQYFIGDFNGKNFKADNLPYPLWIDYGRDNYAGVSWSNMPDNRQVFIGWMSNWRYAKQVPSVNFKSAATLPRELFLTNNGKHMILNSAPAKEIEALRKETIAVPNTKINGSHRIDKLLDANAGSYEIEMVISTSNKRSFDFKLSNQMNEELVFSFNLQDSLLLIDRSKSGLIDFNKKFASELIKAPLVAKDTYKVRLFIDKASSEIFIDNGQLVSTNIIFPEQPYNTLEFNGEIQVNDIKIYNLK